MHTDSPHHRYFRAKEGHWRGKVRFEIINPQRLRASPLRLLDKWSMWSMALVSRRLSTTVDYASQGRRDEVLHTTRMSNLGITLFRSQEAILLDDDGHSFRVTGTQAFFPRLWKATAWAAHGAVAADHDGAVYHIPFFGVIIEQHTRMTPQGLEVIQTTPFSRASILLQWQRSLRAEPNAAPDPAGM
jgi:hemin uptake protein HemP